MFSFEKTGLWRASFGNPQYEAEEEALNALRGCLFNMRARAEHLVSFIPRDIPGLTVHDLTHLDALWETASLIAGDDYPLNPAEAFVFGASVLLHDSAMSLAAYPGGLDELKKTPEWRDAVASRLLMETEDPIDDEQLKVPPDHISKAALADVLRETHASRARELPFVEWPAQDGQRELLIQDSDMRTAYGEIIGQIASSHWWPVPELQNLQSRVNAGASVPAGWYINPLKIACLLRVADASHVDHRRAPRFLRTLVKPNQVSDVHWAFQMKLGKPSIEKNFLVYTAGSPFDVNEAEAWWLCYDMLAAIDDELRAVHGALDIQGVQPFVATAVKGAKSPQAIVQLIRTRQWKPVNTQLRVSDVPSLVELLGGQHLYGSDLSAAMREVIQNGADGIQAKRLHCGLALNFGKIKVRLHRTNETDVLDFEDDGIGMSPRVLTGALLDFGRSFWRSGMMRQEFPGLLSKGLRTTGRFGIGFFSVFMLGDHVTVTSRRYDAAITETHTLDFQKGLRMRPILRHPAASEMLSQPGTRVRVALRNRYDELGGLLFRGESGDKKVLFSLGAIVAGVSPAVDVTIEIEEDGKQEIVVSANDWLTQDGDRLVARLRTGVVLWGEEDVSAHLPNLRPLRDAETGEIHGRACICAITSHYRRGVVTVGGFRSSEMQYIAGILRGEPETAARNVAMPTVPGAVLRDWASEQAILIAASNIADEHKLKAASLVMLCGGDSLRLPVTLRDREYLTVDLLVTVLREINEVVVYEGDEIEYDEDDNVRPKDFKNDFAVSSTLFFVPKRVSAILDVGKKSWPACVPDLYISERATCCEEAFYLALTTAWGSECEYEKDSRTVGEVHGEEISRGVRVYGRPVDISKYVDC